VDFVRKRFGKRKAILVYHRVTRLERDPQLLAVTPEHFAEHLDVLRRKASVVALTDLAGNPTSKVPSDAVSITFDDGYADNLLEAKPILERNEMPATVFVTSAFVGSNREFWWDELDRIFLQPVDGEWNVEQNTAQHQRRQEYMNFCNQLRGASAAERTRILESLREERSLEPSGRPTHRTMNEAEVRQLAQGGLIEIGAHTASHPLLSSLDNRDQIAEIEASKNDLQQVTQKPVVSFAYPYGGKKDYTRQSVEFVRKAGFLLACSNFPGMIWGSTNRFELPRFLVRDWDGEEFERRMERIFA
jgi:peptidoglycan/xylan/chitin deacetylase (PgdA/CDA1 family)